MAAGGQDVRQLLLQVDASVALAQRNLVSLGQTVDRETREMERKLQRPEDAMVGLERAFGSMNQVLVASANQQRAFGMAVDQVTAKELQAAAAVGALARAVGGLNSPMQIATSEQLQAAAAIGAFAAATNRLSAVQARGAVSAGQYRAGTQQLGFQIGDVAQQISLGISPLTVFAQQSGQVTQAMLLMRGEASAFWRFMGGPWGAVITGAVTVLGMLAFGHRSAGSASEEHETAEQTLARALRGEEDAINKVQDALREQRGESERAIQTDIQRAEAANATAASYLRGAQAIRRRLLAELEYARHQAQETSGTSADPNMGEFQALQNLNARNRIAEITAEIAEQRTAIADAQATLDNTGIVIAGREVEASMDGAAAATLRYERALARLNGQYRAIGDAEYRRRRGTLDRERDAAIAAARGSRTDGDITTFQQPVPGRPAHPFGEQRDGRTHGGVDIPVGVGTPVGAAAGGTVIEIGNIAGYGNVVVIDHGRGTTTRYAHLSQILAQRGQRVDQGSVIGLSGGAAGAPGAGNSTGPHLHYEVRRGGRAVNPMAGRFPTDQLAAGHSAESAAERAERERLRRERNQEAFDQDLARANEQLLQARNELVSSAEAQVAFQVTQLEMERARLDSAIQAEVVQGRYTQAQADQLKLLNERTTAQRIANVRARDQERADQDRLSVTQADLRGEAEIEQLRGRMVETAQARRDSQIRLLDLSQQQERLELEAILASRTATDAQKQIARAQLSRLDIIRGLSVEGINRDNEGPRARYMRELRAGAADVNTQLEELDVRAMQALDHETQNAIKSVLGLHGALGDIISDLIMIFVRQQLLLPFSEMMDGGGGGGGGGGGIFGTILSAIGLVSGGGGSFGGMGATGSFSGGMAKGGPISPGRAYMVGERGPEMIVPKVPGIVIPNHALGGGGIARVQLELSGDIDARIARVSGAVAVEVVRASEPNLTRNASKATIDILQRPPLA